MAGLWRLKSDQQVIKFYSVVVMWVQAVSSHQILSLLCPSARFLESQLQEQEQEQERVHSDNCLNRLKDVNKLKDEKRQKLLAQSLLNIFDSYHSSSDSFTDHFQI